VNTYLVILDKLDAELQKRKTSYEDVKQKFSFLLKFTTLSPSELDLCVNELCKIYNNDLDEGFANECQHFLNHLLSIQQLPRTVLEISMLLKENNISDHFPYIDIVSRFFYAYHPKSVLLKD
jgi:DNA-directed RNA polymerase subunit F